MLLIIIIITCNCFYSWILCEKITLLKLFINFLPLFLDKIDTTFILHVESGYSGIYIFRNSPLQYITKVLMKVNHQNTWLLLVNFIFRRELFLYM
ncbi:hypothetical protein GLOIN_2v1506943 [Rhizophagus irregularis DAOM 181602=DAOM 197198]|uniref:Uncharacterized protein n=1 Tax=Rhizophagus irregularis (strain DAOM 181602 / DAOM 197198 / MUCL 43194) TaxID=747089 RepID=A0A2P4QVE6_RHIID|nr:hypothetical protein GLOIN_2v1506943 [Rhizophagus irregularis DAOM 181602=DAOM 197198]POG81633.1 hypothetical protein GLOIN_2v1506943 [Rhizophagus irregularis DAOM 181602=DAOM 197198]|eukprot:XP_025188499.1 hypothetical protein GLOIN_2v1506943 [Rhizophagus irregularis DAOM 181602=DAOM 197198]